MRQAAHGWGYGLATGPGTRLDGQVLCRSVVPKEDRLSPALHRRCA